MFRPELTLESFASTAYSLACCGSTAPFPAAPPPVPLVARPPAAARPPAGATSPLRQPPSVRSRPQEPASAAAESTATARTRGRRASPPRRVNGSSGGGGPAASLGPRGHLFRPGAGIPRPRRRRYEAAPPRIRRLPAAIALLVR